MGQHHRTWTIRVKSRSDALVRRAAVVSGVSVADFVEQSAVARAEALLPEHTAPVLSPDAFGRFVDQLDGSGDALPQLVELFSQKTRIPTESV